MKIFIVFISNVVATVAGFAFLAGLVDMALAHYTSATSMFADSSFLWSSGITFGVGIILSIAMIFSTVLSAK